MKHGVRNAFEHVLGGRLHHCNFCRLQFYDRRPLQARQSPSATPFSTLPTAV